MSNTDIQINQLDNDQLTVQIDQHQYDIAKQKLEAQMQDRKEQRELVLKIYKMFLWAISLMVVVILLFLAFAIIYNQSAIALKVIEIVGAFATGGISGYALGKSKR